MQEIYHQLINDEIDSISTVQVETGIIQLLDLLTEGPISIYVQILMS